MSSIYLLCIILSQSSNQMLSVYCIITKYATNCEPIYICAPVTNIMSGENLLRIEIRALNHQRLNMFLPLLSQVDIFKKDLLLIPIHLEVHWSLVSVDIPRRAITYFDSQRTLNRRCPKVRRPSFKCIFNLYLTRKSSYGQNTSFPSET